MSKYVVRIDIQVTQGDNLYSGNGSLDSINKTVTVDSFEKMSKLVGEIVRHIPKESK